MENYRESHETSGTLREHAASGILEGSMIGLSIQAKDEDGLPVAETSKLEFVVSWRSGDAGTSRSQRQNLQDLHIFYMKSYGSFQAPLFSSAKSGRYHVWVSKVITASGEYEPRLDSAAHCGLPIVSDGGECALTITVEKPAETSLNLIMAGAVGVVTAGCIALLLFYMKRHPKK